MTFDERPPLFEPDPVLDAAVVESEVIAAEPVDDVVALGEEPARRVNPWVVGMWIASVILIVVGVWVSLVGYRAQYDVPGISSTSDGTLDRITTYAVMSAVAPGLVTIGLASALAAASIHAVQWMRRHP